MPTTRILILGIDAANPELLLEWAADGTLPNLAGLLNRGRSGRTHGLEGFFIGSTWPSIYTGLTPATHGFHYLVQLRSGTYDYYRPADHGLFHGTPFWTRLSGAGRRVAILDAPLSPVDHTLNGIQILEWGGHDSVYGFKTRPPDLADSILARFGKHPAGTTCDGNRSSASDYADFLDALVHGVETKTEMTRHFLSTGDWDLLMQVFSEAHCAGHQCWHLHDKAHPAYDSTIAGGVGDPLRRVYRAVDAGIGEVLEEAGDCTVFVFSSHGMSHWYGAQFLLSEILIRLGVAKPKEDSGQGPAGGSLAMTIARQTWHWLPPPIRTLLAGARKRYGPAERSSPRGLPTIDVAPGESHCFSHKNGFAVGGIRLNLENREPAGTLKPGAEADEFCRRLTEDLLDIVETRSGLPLISRVIRVADHYDGPRLAELPDLLVEYNDRIPVGSQSVARGRHATLRVRSAKIGVVRGANSYGRTGEHRAQGLLIAAGRGISPGRFSRPVSILDLAPTWTHMLGVELAGVDGRIIDGVSPLPDA